MLSDGEIVVGRTQPVVKFVMSANRVTNRERETSDLVQTALTRTEES
jgi:hypothetical protein